jgi:hypothetical protein
VQLRNLHQLEGKLGPGEDHYNRALAVPSRANRAAPTCTLTWRQHHRRCGNTERAIALSLYRMALLDCQGAGHASEVLVARGEQYLTRSSGGISGPPPAPPPSDR